MVKKIFSESRNNGIEIKSKFKNEIDPIVQSSTKFVINHYIYNLGYQTTSNESKNN